MSTNQRWLAVLGLGAIMSFCEGHEASGLLALLMIGGVFTTLTGKAPKTADTPGLMAYLGLVAVLTLICERLTSMPQV